MENKQKLESYLVDYLINNKSRVVMLSGKWGSGKTHFWHQAKDSIESKLAKSKKPHIYISLYGKASLKAIEDEVFIKAYNRSIDKSSDALDSIEKLSATFSSSSAISLIEKVTGFEIKDILNMLNEQNKKNKTKDAKIFLGNLVICFDDFERKSKDINLNELFGFITNLSLEFGANIVIILNDNVFNVEDKKVFYNVKEKTVNKFLSFEPTPKELFESLFEDERYKELEDYKADILKAIKETEELNARIYIQVLDNCLEWLKAPKKTLDEKIVRVLVLGTFNFVLNHMVLDYQRIEYREIRIPNSSLSSILTEKSAILKYNIVEFYSNKFKSYNTFTCTSTTKYINFINQKSENDFIKELKLQATNVNSDKNSVISEKNQEEHLNWIKENEKKLKALWKYGYRLYYVADVEEETYNEIAEFIKSGILI